MDISVLIVNYNGEEFISQCIDSVLRQKQVKCEIIVIDNQSQDNSLQVLRKYQDKIHLIKNNENAGFGKANNLAAKKAKGRYLYLFNPDAHLVDDLALSKLLSSADSNKQVGIWGTRIQKNNKAESYLKKSYPKQRYAFKNFSKLPGKIPWVIGASMFINKQVYEKINGFDEDFFLYGEETDLCLRCRQQGFAIDINEQVAIEHIGGGSEQQNTHYDRWLKRQIGLLNFCKKHYSKLGYHLLRYHEIVNASLKMMFLRKQNPQHPLIERYQAVKDSCKLAVATKE